MSVDPKNIKNIEFFMNLAKNPFLIKSDYKVLLYLIPRLNNNEFKRIEQSDIVRTLDLDRGEVSRVFKRLMYLNIIERESDIFNKNYKINNKLF